MFKSTTYLFFMTTLGVMILLLAAQIPYLFLEDQYQDLRDDLLRARQMADEQHRLRAFEQLSMARAISQDASLRQAFVADAEKPAAVDRGALTARLPELVRNYNPSMLVVLDQAGKVQGRYGALAPALDRDLEGLPPVEDASKGLGRDWVGRLDKDGPFLLMAASPIHLPQGGKLQHKGTVVVGRPINAALAQSLANSLDSSNSANSDVHVGLFHQGRLLGSSASTATIEDLINSNAAASKDQALAKPWLPNAPQAQIQERELDGTHITWTVNAMRAGQEGSSLGQIIIIERRMPGTNLVNLAARAFSQELPEDSGPPRFVPIAAGMIAFLFGLLLITNEAARPGRRLLEQLKATEIDLEHRDLDTKRFRGVYRQAVLHINSLMLGLRKRLERERLHQEPMLPDDAFEAIEPPSRPRQTPSQDAPKREAPAPEALPFAADSGQLDIEQPKPRTRRVPTSELVEMRPTQRVQLSEEEAVARKSSLRNFIIENLDEEEEEEVLPSQHAQVEPAALLDDDLLEADPLEVEPLEEFLPGEAQPAPQVEPEEPQDAFLMALASAQEPEEDPQEDPLAMFDEPVDAQEAEALREDSTMDIAPGMLQGLLKQGRSASLDAGLEEEEDEHGIFSADDLMAELERSLDEDRDQHQKKTVLAGHRSTLVDDEGVIAELAHSSLASDPLSRSALAASHAVRRANPTSPTTPATKQAMELQLEEEEAHLEEAHILDAVNPNSPPQKFDEITTAELARNDKAFQEVLAASIEESFQDSDALQEELGGSSLSPSSLMERLQEQNKQAQHRSMGKDQISGLIMPQKSDTSEPTMKARNPFVHQAPTTPGKGGKSITESEGYLDHEKLFKEFVATKEKCGESTEGLTLERFKRKLDLNRAALIARYSCRSVRFQVYIKHGKAALKATPIK